MTDKVAVVSVVQQPALVVTVQAPPKLVVTVPIGVSGPPGPAGPQGPPGTGSITWDFYATNWTTAPTQVGTTAAGAVYSYTLSGTTRYRLVPSPYLAAQDTFYSTWDGSALSGPIVSRG